MLGCTTGEQDGKCYNKCMEHGTKYSVAEDLDNNKFRCTCTYYLLDNE